MSENTDKKFSFGMSKWIYRLSLLTFLVIPIYLVLLWQSINKNKDFIPNNQTSQPQKLTFLNNKSVDFVVDKFGKPNEKYEFNTLEGQPEMRVEIHNTYPPGTDRIIKEYIWKYDDHFIVVWFHKVNGKWIVIDTVKYDKGIEFEYYKSNLGNAIEKEPESPSEE